MMIQRHERSHLIVHVDASYHLRLKSVLYVICHVALPPRRRQRQPGEVAYHIGRSSNDLHCIKFSAIEGARGSPCASYQLISLLSAL